MRDRAVEHHEREGAVAARVLMPWSFMESKLVTCPESAHLERIEYENHPLGLLIAACSRFQPACAVTCQRTCAAMLDRRDRVMHDHDFEGEEEDPQIDALATLVLRWQG